MSNKLSKIINYILYSLLGISIVLILIFYIGGVVPGTEGTSMEEPVITELFLRWTYLLVIGTAVTVLGFSIFNMIIHPKGLKKGLLVLLGVAVLIVVAYFLASDATLTMDGYDGTQNEPVTLKWVGTGLWTTYILAIGAVLAILYSEVVKYFK